MAEAFIYAALRTPRGKGKKDGSLHEVKPISLLTGLLRELQSRNDLDTSQVDDVVMGCVTPVGEQGSCIAKTAALAAGWDFRASGVQLNRFCASGLEAVNMAAQKVRSDWEDLVVAGGVESMSRVPLGTDRGAWACDPETALDTQFIPQGIGADLIATIEAFSREDVDRFAMGSQKKAAKAREAGLFKDSVVPVKDAVGDVILGEDEFIKAHTTMEGLASLKISFEAMGAMLRLGRAPALSAGRAHPSRAHGGQQLRDCRRRSRRADRQRSQRQAAWPQATCAHRRHGPFRRGPHDHADRPDARGAQSPLQGRPHDRPDRPVRDQ